MQWPRNCGTVRKESLLTYSGQRWEPGRMSCKGTTIPQGRGTTKNVNNDESGHKISCFWLNPGLKKGAMRFWSCHRFNGSIKPKSGSHTLIKDLLALFYIHFGPRDFNLGMLIKLQFGSPCYFPTVHPIIPPKALAPRNTVMQPLWHTT